MQKESLVPDQLRRAALLGLAGTALLATSGCQAVLAIIAKLHGDDSFDEGVGDDDADKKGSKSAKHGDPHFNRNDPKGGNEDSSASDPPPPDPSSDDPPSDDPAFGT